MFFVIVIVAVVGYIAGRKRDEIIAFCKGLGGQIREKMNGSSDGDIQELLNQFISPEGKYYPAHLEVLKQKIREKPEYRSHAIYYLGNSISYLELEHTFPRGLCKQRNSQFIKDVVGDWMECYDYAELDEILINFKFNQHELDNEVKGILMLIGYEIYAPFDTVHYKIHKLAHNVFFLLDLTISCGLEDFSYKWPMLFPKLIDDFFADLQKEIDAGNFYPKCIDDLKEQCKEYI